MANRPTPMTGSVDKSGEFHYRDANDKEIDVTKPTQASDVLPEFIVCPDCAGERFQVHERGTLARSPEGVITVEYDELAYQCLNCHHVHIIPVRGVVEYQA